MYRAVLINHSSVSKRLHWDRHVYLATGYLLCRAEKVSMHVRCTRCLAAVEVQWDSDSIWELGEAAKLIIR